MPSMIKNLSIFLIFLILLFPISAFSQSDKESINLLDTAEAFFKSLKNKNYSMVLKTITHKSSERIIKDTYKELEKTGENTTLEDVREDFNRCASTCKSYWDGFLSTFDPDLALVQSKWGIGTITKYKAEILITHKKSKDPAKIKMFKEEGKWKVGLVETFWSRKEK